MSRLVIICIFQKFRPVELILPKKWPCPSHCACATSASLCSTLRLPRLFSLMWSTRELVLHLFVFMEYLSWNVI